MLINPVKTKSVVITTRQKYQLSDLSMRLSLGGQNIENVTEHRLIGLIVDNKFRWQAQIEHIMQKHKNKNKRFLLSQLQHIINIDTRKIVYNAHIKPHIDCASVVWDDCGEVHLKTSVVWDDCGEVHLKTTTELPTSKGRQINPSRSIPIYRAKDECT